MKYTIRFFACVAMGLVSSSAWAQQSWLDIARAAIPHVGSDNTYTQPMNYPSTSTYGTNSGFGYDSSSLLMSGRKDWKLGVFVQNADIGAVITDVAPGGAGQLAGLRPNDVIVAVAGSRVGNVDNRIIELAEEIRRNADPMGRISLVVFDSVQRTLRSMSITLNSTSSTLSGQVVTRDNGQLPFGSILTVQIANVSRPFYEIAGGRSQTRADSMGPIRFELNFDPRYIDPRDQYQLSAQISIGNQVLYTLPQPVAFDVRNLGQPVTLMLERASSTQPYPSGYPNVISAGYPVDQNALTQLYVQLLGRVPSTTEAFAWQDYLQKGNSIDNLKAKLLSSTQFRDRFNNEAAYMQQVITTIYNRPPNQQELAFWLGRLQSTGSPELVVGEMLSKNR